MKITVRTIWAIIVNLFILQLGFSQEIYIVSASEVNVRNKASSKSKIIEKLKMGDTITSNGKEKNWISLKVENNLTGFIYGKNLKKLDTLITQQPQVIMNDNNAEEYNNENFNNSYINLIKISFKYFIIGMLLIIAIGCIKHYLL